MPNATANYVLVIDPNQISEAQLAVLMDELGNLQVQILHMGVEFWQKEIDTNFWSQGGEFGVGWAELAASTLKRKAAQGYPATPLVATGKLYSALGQAVEFTQNSATVGIDMDDVPYAKYHDQPDISYTKPPQRILIAAPDAQKEALMEKLQSYITQQTGLGQNAIRIEETD